MFGGVGVHIYRGDVFRMPNELYIWEGYIRGGLYTVGGVLTGFYGMLCTLWYVYYMCVANQYRYLQDILRMSDTKYHRQLT